MKSNGKEHLRLIKTFSSLSLSRSCPKKAYIPLQAPIFDSLSKYLAYSCSYCFTRVIYTICLHDNVSVNMFFLCLYRFTFSYAVFFFEFKLVPDLWTELNMIVTFISVKYALSDFFGWICWCAFGVYLRMSKKITWVVLKYFYSVTNTIEKGNRILVKVANFRS